MNNFIKISLIIIAVALISLVAWNFFISNQDESSYENQTSEDENSIEETNIPENPEPKTIEVRIEGFAFSPKEIEINVGDTIKWTNFDSTRHTATSDNELFDSGLLSKGDSWSYTFNEVGNYNYHCTPHPSMVGTIAVK